MIPYKELLSLMAAADAVVLQGGAGGVMDARSLGRIPILVPRVPVDDEVVDDHQLVFSHTVAELGLAHRAITAAELWRLLDGALAGTVATHGGSAAVTEGVREFERLLSSPPVALPGRVRLRRLTALAASIVVPGSRRATAERRHRAASGTASARSTPVQQAPDDRPRGVDSEA